MRERCVSKAAVVAALLPLIGSSAQAYTVVFDPASSPTLRVVQRIDDLTITTASFSGTFDVIFTSDSFDNVQAAGGHPIYDQFAADPTTGEAVASAVVDQIIAALNSTDANKVGAVSPLNAGVFYVPYDDHPLGGNLVIGQRGQYFSTTGPWANLLSPGGTSRDVVGAAVWASLVAVPEPASALLLLAGLGGAAFRRDRARRAS